MDPFQLLGVRRGAVDAAKLKQAYHAQSLKHHPDAPSGSEAAFGMIAAAYEQCKRLMHEDQWGTSSSSIGAHAQGPPKTITFEPR